MNEVIAYQCDPVTAEELHAHLDAQEAAEKPGLVTRPLDKVQEKDVRWLWLGRIPRGMVTVVGGEPAAGKSYAVLDIAVRVANGDPWPDCPGKKLVPEGVLLFNGEDHPNYTLRPRARGLGYRETGLLHIVDGVRGKGEQALVKAFELTDDGHLAYLEEHIASMENIGLIAIDTIDDCLTAETDTNRDTHVKSIMASLAELAERHDLSIVVVRHLNKSVTPTALNRLRGSGSFGGSARSVLYVIQDPEDRALRHLFAIKLNVGPLPEKLTFRISDGYDLTWGWERPDVALAALLNPSSQPVPRLRDDMATWLGGLLADGPVLAEEVLRQADAKGFGERTLRTAKRELRVESRMLKLNGDDRKRSYWQRRDGARL